MSGRPGLCVVDVQDTLSSCFTHSVVFCFRNVGSFIAAVTALVSAIVMIQTRHDVVNGRSVGRGDMVVMFLSLSC